MSLAPPLDLFRWLRDNGERLKPPVNNFCLHSGADFVVMVVGGPNARADYHVNETEVLECSKILKTVSHTPSLTEQEWFYQHKGDMLLRVVDDGIFRDIDIKEGEMFLLPGGPTW